MLLLSSAAMHIVIEMPADFEQLSMLSVLDTASGTLPPLTAISLLIITDLARLANTMHNRIPSNGANKRFWHSTNG